MATITHICGHVAERAISEHTKNSRQRKIKWLESVNCLMCHFGEQAKQSERMTPGLPALHGSPENVAWATQIRAEKFAHLERTRNEAYFLQSESATQEEIQAIVADVLTETDAKFWINRKDKIMGIAFVRNELSVRKARLEPSRERQPVKRSPGSR